MAVGVMVCVVFVESCCGDFNFGIILCPTRAVTDYTGTHTDRAPGVKEINTLLSTEAHTQRFIECEHTRWCTLQVKAIRTAGS